ncbi:HAMP domain-containing sensor histidine kinase [Thalassobaculum sp. OXR-137]|uniref:sensor histidine kinase n=1 Tax=Thalassobaculum sp. OXR-137 TaxID=3100173 RepID=UPI002AC8DE2D|nr:HAMP domain-containing sensor histidine kinase [Thalassobaculum sp. OXR-137]WPZ33792.1 HAMP domain-containing sensor histidine kinase [Thalassobaculum sp. OXR-137]
MTENPGPVRRRSMMWSGLENIAAPVRRLFATTSIFRLAVLATSSAPSTASPIRLPSRTERRIVAIGRALDAVAAGDLHRRLPVGSASDDLDRVAQAVNTMLDQLAETMEGLRQVSADVAHELRTPLTRLRTTLQRLEAQTDPLDRPIAKDALAQIDSINQVFRFMLQIAQIEAGSPRSRFVPIDMADLCRTVEELYEPILEDDGRPFTVDICGCGATWVAGDRDLLIQMIANLLDNALRHTPPGTGVAMRLARQSAGEVLLEVTDRGPGVPESERDKVFRRLYRLERSRGSEGTGLGLSLVAAVVSLHRSTVCLSDNDPGLKVSIVLPATAPG